jgi:hypothetical protein
MGYGPEPRSKFDALNFAKPLRRLLGIKGNQDIPQDLNVDLLQPVVDINQRGFANYKTFMARTTSFPLPTTTTDRKDLIGWDTIATSPMFDSTDYEVLILGHHSALVFNVAPGAGNHIGMSMEIRGKVDLPEGFSASTPTTIHEQKDMYTGGSGENVFIASLFGNKSRKATGYVNAALNNTPSYGNRFWLPNKMTINRQWNLTGGVQFLAGDLIVDEIFGVVVPKHTAPPLF